MDVHAATRDDRTLRRIVALLVSFAILAERVADRSGLVRLLVLWLLRRAAAVAEEFVFEETGMPLPAEGFAAPGNGPEEALRLAAHFRVLAAALAAMLPDGWLFDRPARRGFALGHAAPRSSCAEGGWRLEPNDTS